MSTSSISHLCRLFTLGSVASCRGQSRVSACVRPDHRNRLRHTGYLIPEVKKIGATSCFICLLLSYVSYRPYESCFICLLLGCTSFRPYDSCFICLLLGYKFYRPYDVIAYLETGFSLNGGFNFAPKTRFSKNPHF